MGRKPCCVKEEVKKGPWSLAEDRKLQSFILANGGHLCWRVLPQLAGLQRCGKSCRLRWINYLRPDVKRGLFTEEEIQMVIHLHAALGNSWSQIAEHLPGRTDNEIKNHWKTHIKKRLIKMGIDPVTHKPLTNEHDEMQKEAQNNEVDTCEITESSEEYPKIGDIMSPSRHPSSFGSVEPDHCDVDRNCWMQSNCLDEYGNHGYMPTECNTGDEIDREDLGYTYFLNDLWSFS